MEPSSRFQRTICPACCLISTATEFSSNATQVTTETLCLLRALLVLISYTVMSRRAVHTHPTLMRKHCHGVDSTHVERVHFYSGSRHNVPHKNAPVARTARSVRALRAQTYADYAGRMFTRKRALNGPFVNVSPHDTLSPVTAFFPSPLSARQYRR